MCLFPRIETPLISCHFPSVHKRRNFVLKLYSQEKNKVEGLYYHLTLSIRNVFDDMDQMDKNENYLIKEKNLILKNT